MCYDYKKQSNIRRIPHLDYRKIGHKSYLSWDEYNELFDGEVVVEEKIDGKPTVSEIENFVFFGEDLKIRHTIRYNKLPSFVIIYDIYCKDCDVFVKRGEKETLCKKYGFDTIPLLFRGTINDQYTMDDYIFRPFILHDYKSKFGRENIEGITIKNYDKNLFGKCIRAEFDQELEGQSNYIKQRRIKDKYNILRSPAR